MFHVAKVAKFRYKDNGYFIYSHRKQTQDMNSKLKGYIYGIIASATYGMLPLFTLPLYGAGMDPFSVLFFRYLIAVCIFVVMLKSRGGDFSLKKRDVRVLALLGIIFTTTSISLFSSYKYMDSGVASTLRMMFRDKEVLSPSTTPTGRFCICPFPKMVAMKTSEKRGNTTHATK